MAWAESGTITKTVKDWGPAGTSYANCWTEGKLEVYTSGEYLYYKLSMRCDSEFPHCYLYLKIYDKVIYDAYYEYYDDEYFWWQSPTVGWQSVSGSVKIGNSSSPRIYFGLTTSQATRSTQQDFYASRVNYTSVSAGTITITDNGNNTFTITATKGDKGTNNPSGGPTNLKWGYSASYGNTYTSGSTYPLTISGTGDTRTVYATATTTATYGNSVPTSTNTPINQYIAPNNPGKPTLDASSLKNNRLTIKQPWTYTWTAAKAANKTSPVAGYRIRIYRNGNTVTGIAAGSGSTIIKAGSNDMLDRDGASNCTITFDPTLFGFKPNDKVKIGIYAYAKNANGDITWDYTSGSTKYKYSLWSGGGSSEVFSNDSIVQNSGVVQVKAGGSWHEGQVYVKAGGTWHEAETVQIRAGGAWHESE